MRTDCSEGDPEEEIIQFKKDSSMQVQPYSDVHQYNVLFWGARKTIHIYV